MSPFNWVLSRPGTETLNYTFISHRRCRERRCFCTYKWDLVNSLLFQLTWKLSWFSTSIFHVLIFKYWNPQFKNTGGLFWQEVFPGGAQILQVIYRGRWWSPPLWLCKHTSCVHPILNLLIYSTLYWTVVCWKPTKDDFFSIVVLSVFGWQV